MARKKKGNGGKRGRNWLQIGFDILGTLIALGPGIDAAWSNIGTPQDIPAAELQIYTGFDAKNPGAGINWSQTAVGVGSVAGGAVVSQIPTIYRRIRSFIRRGR